MLRDYTEGSHVKKWASTHYHRILDGSCSSEFYAYLCSLPWAGAHIDWREIAYKESEIPVIVDASYLKRCRKTKWGSHGFIIIMYCPGSRALLCKMEDAIKDLDLLYSAAPGPRFICGASIESESTKPTFSDFAEYDGFSKLTYPQA